VLVVNESRRSTLLTGASGFVGRACVPRLERAGWRVRCAMRTASAPVETSVQRCTVGGIGPHTDWSRALDGIDAVVHLAARVHVMRESVTDPLAAFRAINVEGTRELARQAAAAGVRRFVFVSSVKVNGEATAGRACSEGDAPHPQDPYGLSKLEAEQALREIEAKTGLEVVILRPPLVYGPGVKGNFLRMLQWVDRGVPLPLGAAANRRSLVFVGNLVDALAAGLEHPGAAGETFLVDDGQPVSTAQLLREIGGALGRPARLLCIPPRLLRIAAAMIGRGDDAERLLGDLVVDGSRIRRALGWCPPFSREDGLAATAAWFRAERR
jgi:nucleoside-diphosphate-sugar epimerase